MDSPRVPPLPDPRVVLGMPRAFAREPYRPPFGRLPWALRHPFWVALAAGLAVLVLAGVAP